MTQKPVFVEGLFTLRNIRSVGAAAVIEILLGAGIAGVLIWQQMRPEVLPPPIVDPYTMPDNPVLPTPVKHEIPQPQQPMTPQLSEVPAVPTPIPNQDAQPVHAPSLPPVSDGGGAPADLAARFAADMLRAINAQKAYPRISMLKAETGEVVVSFDYADGVVSGIRVDRSSGSRDLDKAAVDAVQRAVLPAKPAELAGLGHFTFTLVFGLGG